MGNTKHQTPNSNVGYFTMFKMFNLLFLYANSESLKIHMSASWKRILMISTDLESYGSQHYGKNNMRGTPSQEGKSKYCCIHVSLVFEKKFFEFLIEGNLRHGALLTWRHDNLFITLIHLFIRKLYTHFRHAYIHIPLTES